MSTLPFTLTPQIDAYTADQVAQAVAAERQRAKDAADAREVEHQRELRQAKRETGEAMHAAAEWERIAKERHHAAAQRQAALEVAVTPLPSWLPGREAVARLTRITRILQENRP